MKKPLLIVFLCLTLCLAACGAEPAPAQTPAPSPTAEPAPTPEPTPTPLPYNDPLSGEGMDEDIGGKRPWAVMINNLEQAQPQCGVSDAEIIYEIPAEGGVTRMLALFSDVRDDEHIGSVRSMRPYYADAALAYDALLVHAGGSEESYSAMRSNGQQHLDGVLDNYKGETFYRDQDRMQYGMEHSMFTDGTRLIAAAQGEGFTLEHEGGARDYGLSFSETASEQCSDEAGYVFLRFNGYKTTEFSYDAAKGVYTARQYGADYIDGNSGEAVAFKNVIVLYASMGVIDEVGRLSVELTGSGDGLFICGGKSAAITWERSASTEPFRYYLADGSGLDLGVGRSYIGVMSHYDGSVSFERSQG